MNSFWTGFQFGFAGTALNAMFASLLPCNFSWFNYGFMQPSNLFLHPSCSLFNTYMLDTSAKYSMLADSYTTVPIATPYRTDLYAKTDTSSLFNYNYNYNNNLYNNFYNVDTFTPTLIAQFWSTQTQNQYTTSLNAETNEKSLHSNSTIQFNSNDERFNKMIDFIYEKEGGYVKSKDENGGAVNFGISQTTYTKYLENKGMSNKDISQITKTETNEIYYNEYWLKSGADRIKDDKLALMVFDTAVNMGVSKAKELYKQCNNDVEKYKELRMQEYDKIAENNPDKSKYLNGWTNRVNSLMEYNFA